MPTTNYGSDPVLSSGDVVSGNTVQRWTTFLKFDLSSVPDGMMITGATLFMYQVNGAGFLSSGTEASYVSDDSWSEGAITWDDQPVTGAVLGTSPDTKDHRGWSQWDLFETAQWDSTADQTDDLLSLAVGESGGSSTHNWCSKESDLMNCLAPGESGPVDALRRPRLEINYVPEPSTALLVGMGLALCGWTHGRPHSGG
jgi:hypothetical protein